LQPTASIDAEQDDEMNVYLDSEACELYCEDCACEKGIAERCELYCGESDCPQHCESCDRPLGNELTNDGVDYVLAHIRDELRSGQAARNAVHGCYDKGYYAGSRHCEIVRDWAEQLGGYSLDDRDERLVDRYLNITEVKHAKG